MSKYKISRRIGRGGMAEVFLAVQEGIGGFEKLVVVKRIFQQFCSDAHFVDMFLQEARLAASIRHPNVVHINDIEQDDEGYFLVMEYLSGESLAYTWEALRSRQQRMPPNIACRIGAAVAAGLHHAHIATDAAGNPQPIVHRDVTPSNLIVCYNGVVKVVDFGVAKATLSEGHTRAGALKGKMSYLSPEQVEDLPIDGRTDVFQLGICLHEMLSGRRLFKGKNDHQKMQAVMEKEIRPPSYFNPKVPRVLDEVILTALERDPQRRHQSADALRRALEGALVELGSAVSDSDVGEWMRESFPDRYAERLSLERECVSQIREGRSRPGELSTSSKLVMESDSSSRGAQHPKTPAMATVLEHQSQSAYHTGAGTRRAGLWAAAAITVFIGLVSVVAWQAGKGGGEVAASTAGGDETETAKVAEGDPAEDVAARPDAGAEGLVIDEGPAPTRISITAVPQTAEIYLDGERVGVGYFETEMPLSDAVEHRVEVKARGHHSLEERFTKEPPERVFRLTPKARRKTDGGAVSSNETGKDTASDPEPEPEIEKPKPKPKPRPKTRPDRTKDEKDSRWKRRRTDNRNPFR